MTAGSVRKLVMMHMSRIEKRLPHCCSQPPLPTPENLIVSAGCAAHLGSDLPVEHGRHRASANRRAAGCLGTSPMARQRCVAAAHMVTMMSHAVLRALVPCLFFLSCPATS